MITAERKPLPEIKESISPYNKILIVGCGTCVAECASGGEKEVALLASALRMDAKKEGRDVEVREITLDRQCVYEFIDQLTGLVDQYDVILSLGCGAGVQAVAEVFPKIHIIPALNTTFLARRRKRAYGLRTAGRAATASWITSQTSARLPAAPKACSTVPAAVQREDTAKSIPKRRAHGI